MSTRLTPTHRPQLAATSRRGHIRAKAPLRLSFAGGGTDVPPFPKREGGLVLSATIDRYAYGSLRPRPDPSIKIESLDLGVAATYATRDPLHEDGEFGLVTAAIRRLTDEGGRGFDLLLHSSAPPGSGLGSSSALMVALIGLLRRFHQLPLSDYQLADLAYAIERREFGLEGGLQDQYASTFGGFNFLEFYGEEVVVNPLRVDPATLEELEYNLLLCFTGTTRSSDHIIADQTQRYVSNDAATLEGLRKQKQLASEMKKLLLTGRLDDFGELLGEAWRYKQQLSPRISNSLIAELYEDALKHGAIGGKVTGAGGGGYMLFYCKYGTKHKVADAVRRLGATVTDFAFEQQGLTEWSYDRR
jgi:D-glycero-alpha-D-manno-heptose-7-phosphate kinase